MVMSNRRIRSMLLASTLGLAALAAPVGGQPTPGKIVVEDPVDGTHSSALFTVDPTTGARTLLSDFGDPSQGPEAAELIAVTTGTAGDVIGLDGGANLKLFSVNPVTGTRSVISDFTDLSKGPSAAAVHDMVLGRSGDLLVVGTSNGIAGTVSGLFSVNRTTGARTLISDFDTPNQGPSDGFPAKVALGGDGKSILVNDIGGGFGGLLLRVDYTTGIRHVVSDFGNASLGAPNGARSIALGPDGSLILGTGEILANTKLPSTAGVLFSVNPVTGVRTIISNFSDPATGPVGSYNLNGVAVGFGGTILVADGGTGPFGLHGKLFRVDPATGVRTLLSDSQNTAQGQPVLFDRLALLPTPAAAGNVLVTDYSPYTDAAQLFRVDPTTGARTVLSDFRNAGQGPLAIHPAGVKFSAAGNILVVDAGYIKFPGRFPAGALLVVNPTTGARMRLSDFTDSSQGPVGVTPLAVTQGAAGSRILVVDNNADAAASGRGALFAVDPATGHRSVLSNFSDGSKGPLGASPFGVAFDASGNIVVTDSNAGSSARGALFRVDPSTGVRTLLSDFGNAAQGPLGEDPAGVVLGPVASLILFRSAPLLVIDPNAGTNGQGALFGVNSSGSRGLATVADFGMGTPPGADPVGVAVASGTTSASIFVVDPSTGTNLGGALFRFLVTFDSKGNAVLKPRNLVADFGNRGQGPLGTDPSGVTVVPFSSGAGFSGAWKGVTQHCHEREPEVRCKVVGILAVTNPGTRTAGRSVVQLFLSADQNLDGEDELVKTLDLRPLRAGRTVVKRIKATLHQSVSEKVLIAVLDATNVVDELNEANNVVVSPVITE
jgi:hypothetical protein